MLMNATPHIDAGFSILMENTQLVSPVSVLYYERYREQEEARAYISRNRQKLQCIVAGQGFLDDAIPFGKAQKPELWDYADNVDTLKFLAQL